MRRRADRAFAQSLTAFGRAMGELPKEQEEGGEILKGFFEKKKKKK